MIRFVTDRVVSASSRRFVRDVAASVLATAIGAVAVSHFASGPTAPTTVPLGKASERLAALEDSFVEETVPVRNTRIFDTLAMFALPSQEPATWSDRPAATARIAASEASPVLPAGTAPTARIRSMPQMVTAAADTPRHPTVLPPSRPTHLAAVAPAPQAGVAEPPREHVRVFGWAVPGTDLIPTRRDAGQALASVGRGATSVGAKTIDTVGDAATGLGRAVSSAGSAVVEAVGLN